MSDSFYSFACTHCGYVTNASKVGVSPYGRVKCPKCKSYYKCYKVKCKFCGKGYTPKNKFQEEIKKCPNCCKKSAHTPTISVILMRIKL